MSCPFRSALESFAAGRLDLDSSARLEAHLPSCAGCRQELAKVRAVRGLLAEHQPYEPNDLEWARLDRNVLQAMERAAAQPRPSLWLRLVPGLSLATAAAAAALLFAFQPGSSPVTSPGLPEAAAAAVAMAPGATLRGDGGADRLLEQSPLVRPGDELDAETGSVTVQTGPATGVHLAEGSRLRVERLSAGRTSLRLLAGEVLAEVKPLERGASFEIHAADLTVAVRGTAFSVQRGEGLVSVEVVHGLVEVTRAGGASSILVPGGSRAEIPDGAPLEAGQIRPEVSKATGARFPLGFEDRDVAAVLADGRPTPLVSDPAGALVRVDGAFRGVTPLFVLLDEGPHRVHFELNGRPPAMLELGAGSPPPGLVAIPTEEELIRARAAAEAVAATIPEPKSDFRAPRLAPMEDPQTRARREAMLFQVRMHLRELESCYERAMKRNPKLEGKVTLVVDFDRRGEVKVSAGRQPLDEGFVQCATESISRWTLPGAGEEERFEIPLQLKPQ